MYLLDSYKVSLHAHFFFNCQVVEIPRGSKVKYELDKASGLIKVRFYFMFSTLILFRYFLISNHLVIICTIYSLLDREQHC